MAHVEVYSKHVRIRGRDILVHWRIFPTSLHRNVNNIKVSREAILNIGNVENTWLTRRAESAPDLSWEGLAAVSKNPILTVGFISHDVLSFGLCIVRHIDTKHKKGTCILQSVLAPPVCTDVL